MQSTPQSEPAESVDMVEDAPRFAGASRPVSFAPSARSTAWLLGLIILLALGLRLYGIDWDDGGLFHDQYVTVNVLP